MGKMVKVSAEYCAKCRFCGEKYTAHQHCDYILIMKKRRGCPMNMCDKFEEGCRKKHKIQFGKGEMKNE